MTTTVTKTIGSGGDYSTLQAWFDAAPANLVTSDQVWQGKILNASDSFVASGGTSPLVMTGHTVDSTRYFELTTAAGASFRDNASVQTNALRYNTSNGCAISTNTTTAIGITVNQDYTRISNLQLSTLGPGISLGLGAGALNCDINNCIIEGNSATNGALLMYGAGNKVRNSLIVQRYPSGAAANIAELRNGSAAYNCTFVVPNDLTAATNGIQGSYSAATLTNCGVFKASAFSTGTAPTLTTCASDLTAATGRIQVAYNTSAFVNITDATRDFRLLTGSGLLDVGTTDSTNAANDIAGSTRPQSTGYDIGAWELVVAAGAGATLSGSASTTGRGTQSPVFSIGL